MRVVVALGGNAMTAADGSARPEDQSAAIEHAANPISDLVVDGHQLVITHGNGPQVGDLLVKNDFAAHAVPRVPLDWCGAQTQGSIGLLILNALDGALARRGSSTRAAALISRTLVATDDPAFRHPSKPIGRYMSEAEAQRMIAQGERWEDRGPKGWRRVVPSPEPLECLDSPAALSLLEKGYVVVCSGGGGIPVAKGPGGVLRGVEAVIDKDLTTSLLAVSLDAERLVIATDVDGAVLGWGTPSAEAIRSASVSMMRDLLEAGEFASGSMGPKVEAACRFAEATGHPAVITSLDRIVDALGGTCGTTISPNTEGVMHA
ncbi:MAG TPA: carbamate kinase [Gemmatimonadaceae bacterium]|nr:carbamate kinase [Gemmatimonadaceae bacterium]